VVANEAKFAGAQDYLPTMNMPMERFLNPLFEVKLKAG
jgi:hypothetical protein